MPEVRSQETEKVTVFKFSHVYDPTRKEPQDFSRYGTITNSNPNDSVFLDAIDGASNAQERDDALAPVVAGFAYLKNAKEVEDIDSGLYRFGGFLKTFGPKTSAATLALKTSGLSELSQGDLDTLWDNVYFQAITTKSSMTVAALTRILRANAFLVEYNIQSGVSNPTYDQRLEHLTKLLLVSGANVEVPSELVARDFVSYTASNTALNQRTKEFLRRKNNSDKARFNIGKLNDALAEIECADKIYSQEYAEAFDKAQGGAGAGASKYVSVASPRDDSGSFEFSFPSPFENGFLDKYVSEDTKGLINEVECKSFTSLTDVADALRKRRSEAYRLLFRNAIKPPRQVIFAGIVIDEPSAVRSNTLMISSEAIPGVEGMMRLFVTNYFTDVENAIVSVAASATHVESGEHNSSSLQPISRSHNHATFMLFGAGLPKSTAPYDLQLSYELERSTEAKQKSIPEYDVLRPQFLTGVVEMEGVLFAGLFGLCDDDTKLYGVKRLGVLEYKRVEQTLCCYVAGEVSHIENVMAREYREKSSRNLTRSEIIQEDTSEKEVENVSDTTTTDRYEMQTEVATMMQEEQSQQIGINAGGSAFFNAGGAYGGDVFANTNMNFTSGTSSSNSFSASESFAQEVTQRALERIVQKTTSKRTSRMLHEYEETNTHGFDNRAGDKHVTGIYRWVDKIYDNELFNYGKRLLYEIMVPEPSRNFKRWMTETDNGNQNTPSIRKPRDLSEFGITLEGQVNDTDWTQITEDNYADLAAEYGADVKPPLAVNVELEKAFSGNPGSTGTTDPRTGGESFELKIPEGYAGVQVRFNYSHIFYGSNPSGAWAYVTVGNVDHWVNTPLYGNNGAMNNYFNLAFRVKDSLGMTVSCREVSSFTLNVVVRCERITEVHEAWQQQTFIAILNAYYKRMDDYNNAMAAAAIGPPEGPIDYNFNPTIGRAIEQRELKRICIEMMLEPFYASMGQDHYLEDAVNTDGDEQKSPCRYYVNKRPNLDVHATYVKFMEEAFDWSIFSYEFFPYYWASVCEWKNLIKEKSSADFLFQSFLQSGMAKVTLPIKIDYEYQVLYFMETGKVWNSNSVSLGGAFEKEYSAIQADLQLGTYDPDTGELLPEKEWKTRIPSSLTIIQSDSAPLNEEGLPCWCEDGTRIATGNNVLAGLGESADGTGTPSSGTFVFPKHVSLTANDKGKLVMNDGDGQAKVYQLGAPTSETTGHWILKLTDLGDITADSAITVINDTETVTFNRTTWRGVNVPIDAAEELGLIMTYMQGEASFDYMTLSIVSDELVIVEDTFDSTEITLDAWPVYSLEVVAASQEAQAAEPTGFPLGKLIDLNGDNAIISSELVETYQLESAFTVTHSIFNSGFDFDLASDADLAVIVNHIMVPAADGKVKPLALTANEIIDHRDFINSKRTQFVGVAINTNGMEVTVMRFSYLSFLTHGLRRLSKKGLFAHENVGEA